MRGMGLLGSLLTVLVATGVIDHASGQNLPVRFISTCPPLIFFSRCGVFRLHPVLRQAGALLAPVLQPKRGGPAMAAAHADLYNMVSQLRLAVAATGNGVPAAYKQLP